MTGGRQVPAPSQVRASVAVVPDIGQVGGAHWVPAAYSWQPPAPSQKPVFPQVVAPAAVHWPFGSMPSAGTGLQVPGVPARAHVAPIGRRPHEPLLQTLGVAQSASAAHVDLQARLPHLNGKQELCGGVTHAPAPSHEDAGVSVLVFAGQLADAHGVP